MNYRTGSYFFLTILSLLLASCASVDHIPSENGQLQVNQQSETSSEFAAMATNDPSNLIAEGKLTEAAMVYLSQANRKQKPEKQQLQLQAAKLLIDAEHADIAANILKEMTSNELSEQQLTFYAYLNARIELHNRNAELGLQWLDLVLLQDYSSFASEADILRLQISAHNLSGNALDALKMRIKLDEMLAEDEPADFMNQQAIIRGFLNFSSIQLIEMADATEAGNIKSWMELSLLIKNSKNPFRLGNMLKSWKTLHPEHPVSDILLAVLAPQEDSEPTKIDNIALLLPLNGSFELAAKAVREGFLGSYYAAAGNSETHPVIRIYDSSGDVTNILATHQQAKDDGADVIVGPLRKEAVEMLAHGTNHSITTLALNQIENADFYANNFYQFPLSPEDEARQAAQRAWNDGLKHAAIIVPEGNWGVRVAEAFREEWQTIGGKVVSEVSYDAKENDFSRPIKSLLAIDASESRKRELSRALGAILTFEPRRRQDIDFVFMGAFPRQARLIPPQLSFFHADKLPIYATSHSFSGTVDRKKDRDLNRVIVGDMPWTIDFTLNDNVKKQVQRLWPTEFKKFSRFYALGSDAYNILFYLNWLRGNSNSRIQGVTGELSLSETNLVMRQLSWAKFVNGRPVLLPNTDHVASN